MFVLFSSRASDPFLLLLGDLGLHINLTSNWLCHQDPGYKEMAQGSTSLTTGDRSACNKTPNPILGGSKSRQELEGLPTWKGENCISGVKMSVTFWDSCVTDWKRTGTSLTESGKMKALKLEIKTHFKFISPYSFPFSTEFTWVSHSPSYPTTPLEWLDSSFREFGFQEPRFYSISQSSKPTKNAAESFHCLLV